MFSDQGGPVLTDLERRLSAFQHDARTPLNVMMGHAQLMYAAPLPAGMRGQVDAILAAGRDLLRLIEDLDGPGHGGLRAACDGCGRRGSNPHGLGPPDFKSGVSTDSTTPAARRA